MPTDTHPHPTDSSTDPDTDPSPTPNLPVPAGATRTYIQVKPTETAIDPTLAVTHARRLYGLGGTDPDASRLRRLLTRRSPPPTIECLLVSEGRDDGTLWYAFGVDDESAVGALERALRAIFPITYEFTIVDRIPTFQGRLLGAVPDRADDGEDDTDGTEGLVAVEFRGEVGRPQDWMTPLRRFEDFWSDRERRIPLAAVAETMAEHRVPIIYQALLIPRRDWAKKAENRDANLRNMQETFWDQFIDTLVGRSDGPPSTLPKAETNRLEGLEKRETHCSFTVNARAVAIDRDYPYEAERAVRDLEDAFSVLQVDGWHGIAPVVRTGHRARRVFRAIQERTVSPARYGRRATPLALNAKRSPGIVADVTELPSFCLLDGAALTAAGIRAVAPTPGERTALGRPSFEQLATYRGAGMPLGYPLTQDDQVAEEPLVLVRGLQTQHVGLFGATGSGKSTLLAAAILANAEATRGADILIDPKGDGMTVDYLMAHYATYGTLDNVRYFNCASVLPAISFFDIRDELEAEIDHTTAVEDKVDHYVEVLVQLMGRERYEQAVRSPDIIRYLVKAMFDPVSGYDAFSHRDLHNALRVMHERQAYPTVSDPDLDHMLAGVVANRARTYDEIMQGVRNRVEKVPVDRRLARIFNHVAEPGDPHFDLGRYLDEDVVIIFDTGDLRAEAQRVVTMVILSELWTALQRRSRRAEPGTDSHPLVNLYIEEAASIANSDLLKQFLAQARGFDASVLLSMQFPAQLRAHGRDVYDEVLNNIGTLVVGTVPSDRRLAERLATDEMDPPHVATRLRALRPGQWLVKVPSPFDEPAPRPFLVASGPPPAGHPEGDRPLNRDGLVEFEAAFDALQDHTLAEAGLTLHTPQAAAREEAAEEEYDPDRRVDSALPYTRRLPPTVTYDHDLHGLRCLECDSRYNPTFDGMARAIECCSALAEVDRDDIPICELNLKLTPDEIATSEWSVDQLLFLQAVYNVLQDRYDPLEYDLLRDSMVRLQEYLDSDPGALQDLIDADLLRNDTDYPYRLYSLTPEGRAAIGESYRRGLDYGHGLGDLDESSVHRLGVKVALAYLEQTYVPDPDSAVVEAFPYYDIDERHRLDAAGLDAYGEPVVAVEVERINNDVHRAVPDDFDKMADLGVEEAIWIVKTREEAHQVLAVLNNPADGDPRVPKTYSPATHPWEIKPDAPGCTGIFTLDYLRRRLDLGEDG